MLIPGLFNIVELIGHDVSDKGLIGRVFNRGLKGQGLMGVNTGKANDWGLYNYVGNAQEWVTDGDGVRARGGTFEDAFSKCDISLEKPHDGQSDSSTGFRVLLELG